MGPGAPGPPPLHLAPLTNQPRSPGSDGPLPLLMRMLRPSRTWPRDSQRQNADSRPCARQSATRGSTWGSWWPRAAPTPQLGSFSLCSADAAALVCGSPLPTLSQPLLYPHLNLLFVLSVVRRAGIPEGLEQLIEAAGVWVTGATPLPHPREDLKEALCPGELPGGQVCAKLGVWVSARASRAECAGKEGVRA